MEELYLKYDGLSDEEKNALLVYKSRLGLLINDDFKNLDDYCDYYNKLLNNPINMFIKMTVFKDIDLSSKQSFLDSLIKMKYIITDILNKNTISTPITIYRALSVNKEVEDISKSEFISTTMDFNQCLKFIIQNDEYQHYIYQINLEENAKAIVIPYSILLNEKTNQLTLTHSNDQKEVLISKDNYEFETIDINKVQLGNLDINMIIMNAKNKSKAIN